MQNNEIFLSKYIISAYDGEVEHHIFSTLKKAVEYCDKSSEPFVENPLNEGGGWLIEKHIIDTPKNEPIFYNQKGVEIKYTPENLRPKLK